MGKCKYADHCGGCAYMGMKYNEQLFEKQKLVNKLIRPFGPVKDIIGMDNPYHYRNKVHGVVVQDKNGTVFVGTYEEKSHRVVRIDSCLLDDEKADAIMNTITRLAESFKYRAYNEDTRRGFLRHILIRTAHVTGEILVTLVVAEPIFPSKNNFIKTLTKEHPEIKTIVMNVNNRSTSMILGEREEVIYGKGYIVDKLCGKTFKISSKSFYQVNSVQTEILYKKAIEYAGLTGKERILDAYSGIGTIGIIASDKAAEVIGVEFNKDAVNDAKENLHLNNCKKVRYFLADAGEFMQQEAMHKVPYDVVFMDPPRAGSDVKFINSVAKLAPKKVVYISCNPETLARDLKLFKKKGYVMKECTPVDMFPWTYHCETCVLLSNERNQHYNISVKVDVGEEYQKPKKITYKDIQDYIKEKYDFFAHSTYIAEVKRECGLDVHEPYNAVENPVREYHCTEERKEQIKEALRHFGLIE